MSILPTTILALQSSPPKNGVISVFSRQIILTPGLRRGSLVLPDREHSPRGIVTVFSPRSAARAAFVANNSLGIHSMATLTYRIAPPDGHVVKKHLNRLLTYLRSKLPFFRYFWFLEFQRRGVVHYHLCSSLPPTDVSRALVMQAWVRCSDQDHDPVVLRQHMRPANFIPWRMSGTYVRKYAAKLAQKQLPPGMDSVGRWWGASRLLAPVLRAYEACPRTMRAFLERHIAASAQYSGLSKRATRRRLKKMSRVVTTPGKKFLDIVARHGLFGVLKEQAGYSAALRPILVPVT